MHVHEYLFSGGSLTKLVLTKFGREREREDPTTAIVQLQGKMKMKTN